MIGGVGDVAVGPGAVGARRRVRPGVRAPGPGRLRGDARPSRPLRAGPGRGAGDPRAARPVTRSRPDLEPMLGSLAPRLWVATADLRGIQSGPGLGPDAGAVDRDRRERVGRDAVPTGPVRRPRRRPGAGPRGGRRRASGRSSCPRQRAAAESRDPDVTDDRTADLLARARRVLPGGTVHTFSNRPARVPGVHGCARLRHRAWRRRLRLDDRRVSGCSTWSSARARSSSAIAIPAFVAAVAGQADRIANHFHVSPEVGRGRGARRLDGPVRGPRPLRQLGHRGDARRPAPRSGPHRPRPAHQARGRLPRQPRRRPVPLELRPRRRLGRRHPGARHARNPGRRRGPHRARALQRRRRDGRGGRGGAPRRGGRDRRGAGHARDRARARVPRRRPRDRRSLAPAARLRRGDHRVPARARRRAGVLRRSGRPHGARQGARRRHAGRCAGGHRGADGVARSGASRTAAGSSPRARSTGTRSRWRRSSRRSASSRSRARTSSLHRIGDAIAAGLVAAFAERGSPFQSTGVGPLVEFYVSDVPVRDYVTAQRTDQRAEGRARRRAARAGRLRRRRPLQRLARARRCGGRRVDRRRRGGARPATLSAPSRPIRGRR